MSNEPYPGTQAVLRALALLKTFTDDRPELSLPDLAELVGLNKTTAYRLLTALESEGLVVRDGINDTYRLGPEAIALGGRAMRANSLRVVSQAELEQLARQTGETAMIEVLSEGKVLTLAEVSGPHLVGATPFVGSHWPLHATSTGKVILAYLPQAERETLLAYPLEAFTPRTLTQPEALQAELVRVREQGFAVGDQELEIGYVSVATPVHNYEGRVIAAVSVGGPSTRLPQERIEEMVALLKPVAARISERLGYKKQGCGGAGGQGRKIFSSSS